MRKFKELLKGGKKKKKRNSTFHVRRSDEKQPRAVTRNTYRRDAFGRHTHTREVLFAAVWHNHSGPLEWLIVFTVIHLFPSFIFRFNVSPLSSTPRRNFTSFLSALTIIHSCHSCHSYLHALIRLRDINYFLCFNVNVWCQNLYLVKGIRY